MKWLWGIFSAVLSVVAAFFVLGSQKDRRRALKAEADLANSAYEKAREDAKRERDKKEKEVIDEITSTTTSGADRLLKRHAKAKSS